MVPAQGVRHGSQRCRIRGRVPHCVGCRHDARRLAAGARHAGARPRDHPPSLRLCGRHHRDAPYDRGAGAESSADVINVVNTATEHSNTLMVYTSRGKDAPCAAKWWSVSIANGPR